MLFCRWYISCWRRYCGTSLLGYYFWPIS